MLTSYRWAMGEGPDADALRRMSEYFPRPRNPMGEAWFMGGRRLYTELMVGSPAEWPRDVLEDALSDLTSGPTSFGHMQDWSEWFRFLLPLVIAQGPRDGYISPLETMVSAVMVHRPESDQWRGDYAQFRNDVLQTLRRAMFMPYTGGDCVLDSGRAPRVVEHMPDGHHRFFRGGLFSASVFLVAKYLPVDLLDQWLESLVRIDDALWRAAWVRWLGSAAPLLCEAGRQPSDVSERLDMGWDESCLVGRLPSDDKPTGPVPTPFLDERRRERLLDAIRCVTTRAELDAWREDLMRLQAHSGVELWFVLCDYDAAASGIAARYELR